MLRQLEQPAALTAIAPPVGLSGTLRKYQLEGTAWMLFLRRFGLGGCLADDMGLGKTIQWIAYLLHLKESGQMQTPALLICPTSVIGNWQKELERFAPDLRVHLHYGSTRTKGDLFPASVNNIDIVITSYTLSHLDEAELSSIQWSSLCLDEAQNIKNNYTKQATAIRGLNAEHRIALTGTPIENRLTELWSIFDFINPGYLSNLGEFRRKYVNVIERTGDTQHIQQVQRLVQPFLLRRLKKDPAIQLDLPDKNGMKTYVSLTVEQGALYENVVQDVFKKFDIRREKAKAKQRRHSESIVSTKASAPASNQIASKQVQLSSASVQNIPDHPLIIQNKHLKHAAPIWKTFYSAISETTH
jgi:SNF2 family DNA or RNA helicase